MRQLRDRWKGRGTGIGQRAQTLMELMLAMIVTMALIYGLIKSSRWVVVDVVDRQVRHDNMMRTRPPSNDPAEQLNPQTYRVRNPDMEYRSNRTELW